MHPLTIPVQRLHEGPLETEVDVPPTMLDLADPDFEFRGTVHGPVTFELVGQDVLASGSLEVAAATRCVRCLAPTELTVRAAVNEVWMPHDDARAGGTDAEDDEALLIHTYRDDLIEPAEVYRELLMLELPENPHCSSDCKGLCPGCGANLNREPCRCRREESLPAAEVLPDRKRKLKDLKL